MASHRRTNEPREDRPGASRAPLWLGGAGALLALLFAWSSGGAQPGVDDGAATATGNAAGSAANRAVAYGATVPVPASGYVLVRADWALPQRDGHAGPPAGDGEVGSSDACPLTVPLAPAGAQEWDNLDVAWAAEPPASTWQARAARRVGGTASDAPLPEDAAQPADDGSRSPNGNDEGER